MHTQLEKLIDLAVIDGVITDKKRKFLYKKAQELSVDIDEFEIYLEGKLHQANKSINPPPFPQTKPQITKSIKSGDLKKCPSCGAPARSFQTNCSDCGHEFSNIEANASIHKLFKMLDEVESQRKLNDGISFGGIMANLATEIGFGIGDKINYRKKEIIRNFPIPNTKEDILEFLSLALPNARKVGNFFTSSNELVNKLHNEFVPVWRAKCEQIIMKAKFSMKDDKQTLDEVEYYAKQLKIK